MLDRAQLDALEKAGAAGAWEEAAAHCRSLAGDAAGWHEEEIVRQIESGIALESVSLVRMGIQWHENGIPDREGASILERIREKTGLAYWWLQGAPTKEKAVADAVLPILAEYLREDCQSGTRCVLYLLFSTRHAQPYFDLLLEHMARTDMPRHEANLLMVALSSSCSEGQVPDAWKAIQKREPIEDWFLAAVALANRKNAPPEIVATLRKLLDRDDLPAYAFEDIARVKDPKIRDWYRAHLNSPDPQIARIARRVAGRAPRPPKGALYPAPSPPDLATERTSFEIDLDEIAQTIREMKSRYGLQPPAWLAKQTGLSFMDLDKWASIPVGSKTGEVFTLWLRLEDYDVVEIVLTQD